MQVPRFFWVCSVLGLLCLGVALSGRSFSKMTFADEPQSEKKDAPKEENSDKPIAPEQTAKEASKMEPATEEPTKTEPNDSAKPVALPEPAAKQTYGYNKDIRPILVENCFSCHGPDSASRKADLRLDKRDAAIEMSAIIPGKPDESGLIDHVFSLDPKEIMPPPESHKKLTAKQREMLRVWVAEGAVYEPHWSLIAPKRPDVPNVKNEKWVRNSIDNFILQELEKRKLSPAPEASRRILARRLSLDLRGIPPTPEEVEAFVNDSSADYYEKYVDRMMASSKWGEHRARYWLDYARYADTHGIHFDNYREMWSYRDWLINAFNVNQTYDQFTIDCLAGDLRPNRTIEQQVGSGFNRCLMTTNEGGIIDEEYLVIYDRDRTETTAQVWLGLTMNCCVCHDHKFDPISQKEFYQMAAFFNNTTQGARDGNIRDTPPIINVPLREEREEWNAVREKIQSKRGELDARKREIQQDFLTWLEEAKPEKFDNSISEEGLELQVMLNEGSKNIINYLEKGEKKSTHLKSGFDWIKGKAYRNAFRIKEGETLTFPAVGDFEATQPFSYGSWALIPNQKNNSAIIARMDDKNEFRGWDLWAEDYRIGVHIINAWPDNAIKVLTKTGLNPKIWSHILVTYDGSQKSSGIKIYFDGVIQPFDVLSDTLSGSIKTNVPLKIGQRNTTSRAIRSTLNDVRIYSRELSGAEASILSRETRFKEIVAKESSKRTAEELELLQDWWLTNEDKAYQKLSVELDDLLSKENKINSHGTIGYVMQEKMEEPHAFILKRGEYDQREEKVTPATPSALPAFPEKLPRNRLGLAQWLLMPEHPLTSRVAVNRIWQEIFGTGIVRTTGDFGVSGELPSHPELLDWLAVEFREGGWDMKKFYKMLVMSATYRQAALATSEKLEKDFSNTYLSRGPRFRMDAEMIRDYMLSASGLLVDKIGGPSVKPYQPDGVWDAVGMKESNTRIYKQDHGDKLYRRSMYSFWKRMAPPAGLEIFNAPNREVCTTRRERVNTPLMALAALNDVQYIEAARYLAQQAISDPARSFEDRLDFLSKRLLCRSFKPEEIQIIKDSLDDLSKLYKENEQDAKKLLKVGEKEVDKSLSVSELAAWTMMINELMNMDEILNK